MGELISGGTDRHGIQDEGLTYSYTTIFGQNMVKQAAIGGLVAATECPNLL